MSAEVVSRGDAVKAAAARDLLWSQVDDVASSSGAAVLGHVRQVSGPGGHHVGSLEEHELLYRLAAESSGQIRIGQLESVVIRDKNKVTRLVDRLEAAGLVARSLCDTDRRVTFVQLTDTGRDMLTAIGPAWARGLHDALARNLTTAQTGRAADLLEVLLTGALATLSTRFGTRTGNDADALGLPGLQGLVTSWRDAPANVEPEHVVTWIRILRVSAVLDDALEESLRRQHDLSRPEAELLLALHAAPGRELPLTALSRAARVTSGGGTRILDRLTERGILTRRRHATDRRSLLAHLTPAGAHLAAAAADTKNDIRDTGIGPHLNPHDLDELTGLLRAIPSR